MYKDTKINMNIWNDVISYGEAKCHN